MSQKFKYQTIKRSIIEIMISMEKIMLLIHLAIPTFSSERLNSVDKYFYGGLGRRDKKSPTEKL